jgi:phage tail sheath gpL-like
MATSTAVDLSAVARVVGIKTTFVDLRAGGSVALPQRIAVVAQGSTAATYATTKRRVTSPGEAASLYGFGSPIHQIVKQLLPINGDGVGSVPVTIYPLVDDGSGIAAAGDITPSVTTAALQNYVVRVNNIDSVAFTVLAGAVVADITASITDAINGTLDMPITAVDGTTDVAVTAKWKGATGNDLIVEIIGATTGGVTYAITQPTSGATNPDVQAALDQVGNVWETMFLNAMGMVDTAALNKFAAFGEGRWGALTRKPMIAFAGSTVAGVTASIAVPDARGTDRTNSQLVAPGSKDLPFVVAARQLARIAPVANNNAPQDYGRQRATGLTPGTDGEQWTYPQRDQAVKAGSSTIEVVDNVVNLSDIVTFYHPAGDPLPAYRFVVDTVKLQNILFNMDLIFATAAWDGAPLIPDDQPTTNATAKKPKAAVAALNALWDSLALDAIISDANFAKDNTFANINESNPKRLDTSTTLKLAGNSNIISMDLNFGFFFGQAAVVA